MPPKYKFAEGEKVLCFHGPLLYEAKVTKVQVKDKVPQFLVHYSGWNKTWDEWVPESRAVKHNDANLQKQKELQQLHPDKKRPTKKKEKPKKEAEPSSSSSRRKRPRLADPVDSPAAAAVEPTDAREIKITIPEELQKWLVDDWDFVTRQKQLVRLPKRETVTDILHKYSEHVATTDPDKVKSGQIEEVCAGLTGYFNAMLGSQLLYKFERPQYEEILKEHSSKAMSDIYGIEHLIRLFVRLGSMLSYTAMDDDSIALLRSHIHDFLKFIAGSPELFSMEYDAAPQEYHRRMN